MRLSLFLIESFCEVVVELVACCSSGLLQSVHFAVSRKVRIERLRVVRSEA